MVCTVQCAHSLVPALLSEKEPPYEHAHAGLPLHLVAVRRDDVGGRNRVVAHEFWNPGADIVAGVVVADHRVAAP